MKIEEYKADLIHKLKNFHILVGMGGVDKKESDLAQKISEFFYWSNLLIVFWLPIQWYLEYRHLLLPIIDDSVDWVIWIVFLVETVTLCLLVQRRWYYLLTNWINLMIIFLGFPLIWVIFPELENLRILRLLLMLCIMISWIPLGYHFLSRNHLSSTLLIATIVTILSGILISLFDPGIKDPFSGIWWAWQTVTTATYGDTIPASWLGKAIAVIIMVMGGVLFSVLTANFSAFLIKKNRPSTYEAHSHEKIIELIIELKRQVADLEKRLQAKEVVRIEVEEEEESL